MRTAGKWVLGGLGVIVLGAAAYTAVLYWKGTRTGQSDDDELADDLAD